MPLPALISGLSGLAVSALNNTAIKANNARVISNQNKLNQAQLDFSKNAISFAAADRMRAGLSPLDAQAASSPSFNMAETQAADFSGVQQGVNNAISQTLQSRQIASTESLNNALKAKAEAEKTATDASTQKALQGMQTELELQKEELSKLRNENSSYARRLEADIALKEKQNADLQSQIDQRSTLTPTIAGLNNARAAEIRSDLTFADVFGVPLSFVRSFDSGSAQSSFVMDALLSKSKQVAADASSGKIDAAQAYRAYVADYDRSSAELQQRIKAWNLNPSHTRQEREDLARLQKELGKKLTFKEFKKRAGL